MKSPKTEIMFFLPRMRAQKKFTDSNTGDETEIQLKYTQWISKEGLSQENILKIDLEFDGTVFQQYNNNNNNNNNTTFIPVMTLSQVI